MRHLSWNLSWMRPSMQPGSETSGVSGRTAFLGNILHTDFRSDLTRAVPAPLSTERRFNFSAIASGESQKNSVSVHGHQPISWLLVSLQLCCFPRCGSAELQHNQLSAWNSPRNVKVTIWDPNSKHTLKGGVSSWSALDWLLMPPFPSGSVVMAASCFVGLWVCGYASQAANQPSAPRRSS